MPGLRTIARLISSLYYRRLIFIFVVLLFLPVVGTTGYMLIEEWDWFDALYMSVITLTTVGYSEVRPLTSAGRTFTVVYLFFGVGTAFYSLTLLAEQLLRSEAINRRIMDLQLRSMDNHYIVCGYGRTGKRVVTELQQLRKPYVVIDIDSSRVEALRKDGIPTVVGDASSEDVLRRAGITEANGLVAALDNDAANVFVVLTARELNERLHIVARAEHTGTEPKLKRAGANAILSPYEIGAVRLTHMLLQRSLIDSFDLVTGKMTLDISIEEFKLGDDNAMCRKTLAELNLRQRFHAIVLAVKHPDETLSFPPDPQTVLEPGSVVIVAAAGEHMNKVHTFFKTASGDPG